MLRNAIGTLVRRSIPLHRDKTCPSTDGRKALAFHCIFKYARQSLASNFDIAERYAEQNTNRLRLTEKQKITLLQLFYYCFQLIDQFYIIATIAYQSRTNFSIFINNNLSGDTIDIVLFCNQIIITCHRFVQ